LLKVALIWATPSASTWRFLRPLVLGFAMTRSSLPYFLGAFFLPATARLGPFRVRALVCVL
jgi:hypothetical protein